MVRSKGHGGSHPSQSRPDGDSIPPSSPELARPSSRLAAFAPFRRSTHMPTGGPPITPPARTYHAGSTAGSSAGGVADVPSPYRGMSASTRPPSKPPKPAALRVKKAKALSISLLGGGSSSANASSGTGAGHGYSASLAHDRDFDHMLSHSSSSGSAPVSARSTTPVTLQEALAAEDGSGRYPSMPGRDTGRPAPPRSASAMDFYRANGPTKGLAALNFPQSDAGGLHRRSPATSPRGPKEYSDELFVIARSTGSPPRVRSRRRSASLSREALPSPSHEPPQSAPLPSSPQGWRLDTARELLSVQRASPGQHRVSPPTSSPSMFDNISAHMTSSRLPLRTSTVATASPFLNTYTARAKMHADQPREDAGGSPTSRIPQRKPVPAQLGKAHIIRSTHRSSSSESSTPGSPRSPQSSMPTSPQRSLSHSRAPSASDVTSSPSSTRPSVRARTQSHAFGSPLGLDLKLGDGDGSGPERPVPQHPLSARSSTFAYQENLMGRASPRPATSSSIAPPPVRRHKLTRAGTHERLFDVPSPRYDDRHRLGGSTGPTNGTSLQALGQQIGGMGAAVGKRGWDMFKQWGTSNGPVQPSSKQAASRNSISVSNEATRRWTVALHNPVPVTVGASGNGVFGRPLRDAVILTRLGRDARPAESGPRAKITTLDLGSEFKIDLPNLDATLSHVNRHAGQQRSQRVAVNRETARHKYLPGLVVRCIEAIETWGADEEGIYRLSGRSTHTAKLRQIFDAPCPRQSGNALTSDLRLSDIGPAELDLNSVCSLLKAFLRDLPDTIIPERQVNELNGILRRECGVNALGITTSFGSDAQDNLSDRTAALKLQSSSKESSDMSARIARIAIKTVQGLPAANWYLLRELASHLADMTVPDVVAQTRMPLSNLCLVLAPTLSLSVPLMRALVEQREMLFGNTIPAVDVELDQLEVQVSSSTSNNKHDSNSASQPDFAPSIDVPRLQDLNPPTDQSKRMSIATVTDRDKRRSTSSVSTLQPPTTRSTDRNEMQNSSDSSFTKALLEEDDVDLFSSPPIAAQFIRQRKASIAGSLDSPALGSDGGTNGFKRSTIVLPPSMLVNEGAGDHDSINSSGPSNDDYSSAASSLAPSISSESLRSQLALGILSDPMRSSSSIGSVSALDRPRPPTGGSAKFLSGRPAASPLNRHHKVGSDATSSLSMRSTQSNGSNDGPTTPVAQKREMLEGPLMGDADTKTARASPALERFVDDAPMDVKAVRRYWSARPMD